MSISIKELISYTGSFIIPVYQRDFVWNRKYCIRLIEDILENREYKYNIGMFLYYVDKENDRIICDGQQRLTTLFLFLSILYNELKENTDDDSKMITEELRSLISNNCDFKLKSLSSLNNKFVFSSILESGINDDNRYGRAYSDIKDWLLKKFTIDAKFAKTVILKLENDCSCFINEIGPDENSLQIYNSCNSKGLLMSLAEQIKSYMFMHYSKDEQEKHLNEWDRIIQDTERKTEIFFKAFITAVNFKTCGSEVSRQYNEFVKWHRTKRTNDDAMKQIQAYSHIFYRLFVKCDGSRFPLNSFAEDENPMLYTISIALYYRLKKMLNKTEEIKELFEQSIDLYITYVGRRRLMGLDMTNLQESTCHIIREIENVNSPSEIYNIFKKILFIKTMGKNTNLPNDGAFKNFLCSNGVYNMKSRNSFLVYLLSSYENEIAKPDIKIDKSDVQIEHIMPRNPKERNLNPQSEEFMNHLDKLGNLALIPPKTNTKVSNLPYPEKRKQYEEITHYVMYRELPENWDYIEIDKRTNTIADFAVQLFKLPEYVYYKVKLDYSDESRHIIHVTGRNCADTGILTIETGMIQHDKIFNIETYQKYIEEGKIGRNGSGGYYINSPIDFKSYRDSIDFLNGGRPIDSKYQWIDEKGKRYFY
jgi:uncharacterized protein with ParB-like and HNH nuclease domain